MYKQLRTNAHLLRYANAWADVRNTSIFITAFKDHHPQRDQKKKRRPFCAHEVIHSAYDKVREGKKSLPSSAIQLVSLKDHIVQVVKDFAI